MKRLTAAILTIFICVFAAASCAAQMTEDESFLMTMQIGSPIMTVNGAEKEIDPGNDTCPIIENGRTLVPVRAAAEAMGADVQWDYDTQTVTLTKDDDKILLVIGSATAKLDGNEYALDTEPVIINGRTMLPIRFIAESFGYNVAWDNENQIVTISSAPATTEETENETEGNENSMTIAITIGKKIFTAHLYDNETARAFAEKLPMTIDMSEFGGNNEYYYYFDSSFPTETYRPNKVSAGDLKLYGNDCLVIFYKSFNTSYSYTDIGYIEDPAGLEDALNATSGTVTIERGIE
ncbi:MAG: hypothetical protein LUG52_01935 [Clostridia bacterium]|nr:hypothetical protein [Clostridia bacterium]